MIFANPPLLHTTARTHAHGETWVVARVAVPTNLYGRAISQYLHNIWAHVGAVTAVLCLAWVLCLAESRLACGLATVGKPHDCRQRAALALARYVDAFGAGIT